MNIAYHFFTSTQDGVLNQIEEREKIVLGNCELDLKTIIFFQEHDKELQPKIPQDYSLSELPTIEELFPQVIVRVFYNLISVYPIITTHYQKDNFIKLLFFNVRNIIYKHGWIVALQEKEQENEEHIEGVRIDLFLRKKNIASVELYGDELQNNLIDSTFEVIMPQQIRQALSQLAIIKDFGNFYNKVPLFLPQDWKEKWTVYKRTSFITFCK